jgi:hypothetical protein
MSHISQLGETRNIFKILVKKKLKERDRLGNLDRMMILKRTLKKFGVKIWVGFF